MMKENDKSSIQNPHDKFFKEFFSEKEEVTEFITKTFPANLLQKLDLSSLSLDNQSYVDEQLQSHYSDLVYNCNYSGGISIKITLLFEHKSYQPITPIQFQLMRYMLNIWEQNISQKEHLSPIIPLIVYHGKSQWKKKDLSQYFTEDSALDTELIRFLPQFDYLLTDLTTYADEQIRQIFQMISLQMGLLLMKKIFEQNLEAEIKEVFAWVNELLKTEKGKRIFQTLLLYLYYTSDIKMEKILETMQQISDKAQQETWTIAKRLKLEGKLEGKLEIVDLMLQKGLEATQIAELTGMDLKTIQAIQKQKK